MSIINNSIFKEVTNDKEIKECNCPGMSRSERKRLLEEPIIDKIKEVFSEKKSLCIYSLGSGGCYQELSLCKLLADEGYTIEHFVLVDMAYLYVEQEPRVVAFTKYFKKFFPDQNVSVFLKEKHYYQAIQEEEVPAPDVMLCVDMDPKYASAKLVHCKNELQKNENSSTRENTSLLGYFTHMPRDRRVVQSEIIEIDPTDWLSFKTRSCFY